MKVSQTKRRWKGTKFNKHQSLFMALLGESCFSFVILNAIFIENFHQCDNVEAVVFRNRSLIDINYYINVGTMNTIFLLISLLPSLSQLSCLIKEGSGRKAVTGFISIKDEKCFHSPSLSNSRLRLKST
jgi:hypothetical protein